MSLAVSRGASSPANKEFKKRLGQAIDLKNQERYREAALILEELRETNPQSASVHALLGHVLWEQDDLARAVPSFKRAVTLSPESELASLGLFHTLMGSGDRRGAIGEMNRFLRGTASKEYDAIVEEFGIPPLRFRYVYLDNSTVFIEGQRLSAVVKGMALDIEDALRRSVFDFTWRLDLGKLHQILFGLNYEVGFTKLWGSQLSQDSFWKMAKSKEWQVTLHERSSKSEKTADVEMAYQIAKDAAHIDKAVSELILVTGDNDFVPVVQDLVAEGFNVTVAFWGHAGSKLREVAPFLSLDKSLDYLGH